MGWLRRFPVSAACLVVYLVACMAGTGLHHHGHGTCHATAGDQRGQELSRDSSSPAEHDDGEGCAVCTALHLAQAPVTVTTFALVCLPAGEAWITPVIKTLPGPVTAAHARAPPV